MKAACKDAKTACEMQVCFDNEVGSHLETPVEQINEWIQNVKSLLEM